MKPTLQQKILLLNALSVLMGIVGGVISSIVYDSMRGRPFDQSIFWMLVILLLLFFVPFCYLTAFKTDAEVYWDLVVDERRITLKERTTSKEAHVAINEELKKAAQAGELEKAHSLAELKGKL